MHLILAQLPDPASLLTGTNILIVVVLIGAAVIFRNRDAIKNKLSEEKQDVDNKIQELKDKVGVPTATGEKVDINEFFEKLEKGIASSDPVRKMASTVCRSMIKVAASLPNKAKADECHQKLRDLFLEFGDPTPAEVVPADPNTPVTPVVKT